MNFVFIFLAFIFVTDQPETFQQDLKHIFIEYCDFIENAIVNFINRKLKFSL